MTSLNLTSFLFSLKKKLSKLLLIFYLIIYLYPELIILSHTAKTCPHLDTITSFIAKKPLPFDGKGFSAVNFIPEVMLISRIIGTNILPTQQLLALSPDRAKFLYAFLHGDSIDLGSAICAHMLKIFSFKQSQFIPTLCLFNS